MLVSNREKQSAKPRRHHLDRFADRIAENGDGDGKPDDLLTTRALAVWLGVSEEWLEIGRRARDGYGPRFIKLARNIVRYRRSDVLDWLEKRSRMSVSGYAKPAKRRRRRGEV
jgi:predicted DNA-binding transcriptional regulator AlpA